MDLKAVLSFRQMITPVFIQILFWIGTAVCVFWGLSISAGAFAPNGPQQTAFGSVDNTHSGGADLLLLLGLGVVLIGPIFWRVCCELLIVIFGIHSELVALRNTLGNSAPKVSNTPPASVGVSQVQAP
jgi:hypothetical protein